MSFRTFAAVVVTVTGVAILGPSAMAATPGAHQVTGRQLKSALVPASAIGSSSTANAEFDTGRGLEHGPAFFRLPTMSCHDFWVLFGVTGYGETASASDRLNDFSSAQFHQQIVYQFASPREASSFLSQEEAKYPKCRSFVVSGGGPTLRVAVYSMSRTRVGGHQAFQVAETETISSFPATPLYVHLSFTVDGADVFIVTTENDSNSTPVNPSLPAFTLRLIARVAALR